jgi:hypothetical protein
MDRFRASTSIPTRTSGVAAALALLIDLAYGSASAQLAVSRGVPPQLREGTQVLSAPGYLVPSLRDPGLLVFRFEDAQAGGAQRALVMLPGDAVEDARSILADEGVGHTARFEATGIVYAYERRSFLLATALVPLPMPAPPGMLAAKTPPELEPPPPPPEETRAPRLDAYAASEAAELARVPLRGMERPTPLAAGPADEEAVLDDGLAERLERRLEAGIASAGAGLAPKPVQAAADRILRGTAGERFQDRRASVLRDPVTGAWRVRFDTGRPGEGAHDGAEASVEVLPCRTLETLARSVRQQPIGSSWLLSGEFVTEGGRRFVLLDRAVANPRHRFLSR